MRPIENTWRLQVVFQNFFESASRAKIFVLHLLLSLLAERSREDYMVMSMALTDQVDKRIEQADGIDLARKVFTPLILATADFPDLTPEAAEQLRQCLKRISLALFEFKNGTPPTLEDYLRRVFEPKAINLSVGVAASALTVQEQPPPAGITNPSRESMEVGMFGKHSYPLSVVAAAICEYYERRGYQAKMREWPGDKEHQGCVDVFAGETLKFDVFFTSAVVSNEGLLRVTVHKHHFQ